MSQSPGTFTEVLCEDSVLAAFRSIDQIGNLATTAPVPRFQLLTNTGSGATKPANPPDLG